MIFDPPPRSRRRVLGRFMWPVLVVAAVTIALIVSAAGAETRSEIDYMTEIRDQAIELAKGGEALRLVVGRLHRVSRTEFVTVIDDIREDLAVAQQFVDEEPPTTSVAPIRALYRETLSAWESGLLEFSTGVLAAADDPDDNTVIDAMAAGLAELRAGDSLYLELLAELERDDLPDPVAPLPEVVMMPADAGLVTLSISYADSARSPNNSLALRPGLALSQIVAEPEWEIDASDQVAMPATENVVFRVVVSNLGNVVSPAQQLVISLTGGPETVRDNLELEPLQPSQQVTLTFEPMPVLPGGIYEVTAALVVTTPDANADDNELVVQFIVNEA